MRDLAGAALAGRVGGGAMILGPASLELRAGPSALETFAGT